VMTRAELSNRQSREKRDGHREFHRHLSLNDVLEGFLENGKSADQGSRNADYADMRKRLPQSKPNRRRRQGHKSNADKLCPVHLLPVFFVLSAKTRFVQFRPNRSLPSRLAVTGQRAMTFAFPKLIPWLAAKPQLGWRRILFRGRIFLPMATRNPTLEYLTTTKIGEKGQLTVPKQFREDLGLGNGAPFAVLRLGDGLILLPEQQRFEQLCQQVSSSLTAAGLTSGDLVATLPEARNQVYARRYGKKAPATALRRRSRSYRGK